MMITTRLRWYLLVIFLGLWWGQFWSFPLLFGFIWVLLMVINTYFWPNLINQLMLTLVLSLIYGQTLPIWQLSQQDLHPWQHRIAHITGTIDAWPEQKNKHQQAFVRVKMINNQPVNGRILLVMTKSVVLKYQQDVVLVGTLSPPQNFNDFDYVRYLRRHQVQQIMRNPESFTIMANAKSPLTTIRHWFEHNLNQHLPTPNSTLASGVLIGNKRTLQKPYDQYFKTAGLQHLIVVSGSNVAIVMACVTILFRRLGPRINGLITFGTLILFALLTGADPPVLRATIFGMVLCVALNVGRFVDIRNLLLLAAVLIGLQNPMIVQFDLSFWLSFAATAGIILGLPIWNRHMQYLRMPTALNLLLGVSFCAQLAVLPVLILGFGTFPWVGLISNLLAEPLIPFVMLSSFMAGLIPHQFFAFFTYLGTELLVTIANTFGPWPLLEMPKIWGKYLSVLWTGAAIWALFRSQALDDLPHFADDGSRS